MTRCSRLARISYGYDQASELTSVERPKEGETSEIKDTYTYDGNGLRASQTISGTTTYLTWDMTEELPSLLSLLWHKPLTLVLTSWRIRQRSSCLSLRRLISSVIRR